MERYLFLEEMLIKTSGHVLLLRRIKGKKSEPINLDLLDFKDEIDADIKYIINKIDKRLDLFTAPDGMK